LENEIPGFATQHAEYSRDKYIDIIRKTWRKMSPRAQELARGIAFEPAIGALVQAAIAES
jgi:tRNAThr (cytosine32-N3)-methyltransferase